MLRKELYVSQGEVSEINNTFPTIMDAINNSFAGETIKVESGIYKENILINKSIKLIGVDKNNTIIIANQRILIINASDVIISAFTIRGGTAESKLLKMPGIVNLAII